LVTVWGENMAKWYDGSVNKVELEKDSVSTHVRFDDFNGWAVFRAEKEIGKVGERVVVSIKKAKE